SEVSVANEVRLVWCLEGDGHSCDEINRRNDNPAPFDVFNFLFAKGSAKNCPESVIRVPGLQDGLHVGFRHPDSVFLCDPDAALSQQGKHPLRSWGKDLLTM